MNALRRQSQPLRHVFLTLAALALMVKVLVPPGFMVGTSRSEALPLVLCTAQGTVAIDAATQPGQQPAGKSHSPPSHDGPCAFAGHAGGAAAPSPFSVAAAEFVAYLPQIPAATPRDLAPGRGLAAPPLPARGPPIQLT